MLRYECKLKRMLIRIRRHFSLKRFMQRMGSRGLPLKATILFINYYYLLNPTASTELVRTQASEKIAFSFYVQ